MKTLKELANSVDYQLLRVQKTYLVELMISGELDDNEHLSLEGILSLIDNLQDTIVEVGLKTEKEVFG